MRHPQNLSFLDTIEAFGRPVDTEFSFAPTTCSSDLGDSRARNFAPYFYSLLQCAHIGCVCLAQLVKLRRKNHIRAVRLPIPKTPTFQPVWRKTPS